MWLCIPGNGSQFPGSLGRINHMVGPHDVAVNVCDNGVGSADEAVDYVRYIFQGAKRNIECHEFGIFGGVWEPECAQAVPMDGVECFVLVRKVDDKAELIVLSSYVLECSFDIDEDMYRWFVQWSVLQHGLVIVLDFCNWALLASSCG